MEKSQFLEEIKSTAENCFNAGYKCGYESAISDIKEKIIKNLHVEISAKMLCEILEDINK